MRRMNAHKNKF